LSALRRSSDSTESTVAVARALANAPAGDARWLTPEARQRRLGGSLLYRGHVREAATLLFDNPGAAPPHLVEAALLSPSPPDSAGPIFRRWLDEGSDPAVLALPWWTAQRDGASIRELQRKSDSMAGSRPLGVLRDRAAYASKAALAYLTLLRGDTTAAIRRFEAPPDSLCPFCYFQRLPLAQLLSARREDRKALRLLDG
jgi:hypothetical protein